MKRLKCRKCGNDKEFYVKERFKGRCLFFSEQMAVNLKMVKYIKMQNIRWSVNSSIVQSVMQR
ncbi:hypothetical protein MKA54_21245 [[Clostridium] innocuum]|nr:hypothetical protein [[Clostridium] innocuum]